MSMTHARPITASAKRSRRRIERRWATLSIVIVGVLVGMVTFTGIHQATMPQAPCRDRRPQDAAPVGRVRREQSRQRARGRRLGHRARDRAAIFVHAAMHRGAGGHAGHVPRHQRRRGPRLPDRGHQHQHDAGAGLRRRPSRSRFKAPGEHLMPCHEFCGIGHEGMWGKVKVVDKAAVPEHGGGAAEAELC